MREEKLLERKEFLTQEEIDRAAGLLVAPLAQNFRASMEWIARSKSVTIAVDYIYKIATDKKFKSAAKRQQFLSLLTDRIVSHLNNLFTSGDRDKVKSATEYAVKFANIVGSQDVAAYVDVIAKNLNTIETVLYDIMRGTMMDRTLGASRTFNEIADILKGMNRLGFTDTEMKIRSKYKSEKILNTPPNKPSTWGYYELYDVLDTMASGRDTVVNRLEDLSAEAQDKILGLKDYFLYREWYHMTDGRVSEYVKFIIDERYPQMKRFGLPWPELDFKYSSTEDMLEFYKKPIIKMLLKSVKGINRTDAAMVISNLRKSGVNWPELDKIEAVTNRKSITESRQDPDQMSEREQIEYVRRNWDNIMNIQNPSERVQLAAVKQDGVAIFYIQNPTERVKLAAVERNGYAVRYIKNPCERVQLAAVNQYGGAISYILGPSLEVQLAAVKQDTWAIRFIKTPSPEVQIAAVKQDFAAISYIRNPSPELFANPEVKDAVIKRILVDLKEGKSIDSMLNYLSNHRVSWPELDTIRSATSRKPIQ